METKNQKIEIKTNGAFSEIYVDGHLLRGVRRFKLEQGVGDQIPMLTVDLNALNLSVDGRMILKQEGYGEINIELIKTEEKKKANWNNYPPIEECTDMGDTNENIFDMEIKDIVK